MGGPVGGLFFPSVSFKKKIPGRLINTTNSRVGGLNCCNCDCAVITGRSEFPRSVAVSLDVLGGFSLKMGRGKESNMCLVVRSPAILPKVALSRCILHADGCRQFLFSHRDRMYVCYIPQEKQSCKRCANKCPVVSGSQ